MSKCVTFFPDSGAVVRGYHEDFTGGEALMASLDVQMPEVPQYKVGPDTSIKMYDQELAALAASVDRNRDAIRMRQLNAAAYVENKANLDHLILVRLHNRLQGAMQKWFFLDEMFTSITMDKLTLRMSFRDNPAAA